MRERIFNLITLLRNLLVVSALALYAAAPASAGEGSGSCECDADGECCFCQGTFCGTTCTNIICDGVLVLPPGEGCS